MQAIDTDRKAVIVSDVVESLITDYRWPITDAISDVAEVLEVSKAAVFEAWLYALNYTSSGL